MQVENGAVSASQCTKNRSAAGLGLSLQCSPRPHLDLWGREEKEKRGRGMVGKGEGDEKGREEEGYKGEQQK